MLQGALSAVVVIIAGLMLTAVIWLWWRRSWFIQWLKGTLGFLLLFVIVILAFGLLDVWSYKQLQHEEPIATVMLYKVSDKHFELTLVDSVEQESRYTIYGDQWQLDARLLTWKGPLARSGLLPLYRLDRLAGRYLSLEQELNAQRTVYQLNESVWFDVWHWLNRYSFWLDANYGSAVYMPLSHGAMYSILLTPKGLLARPLNDAAKQALNNPW